MFDYARNVKLALTDQVRAVAIKAAAGIVILIGAVYLMNALWYFLAVTLDWGPTAASAIIGGVFVVAGLAAFFIAGKTKHEMPGTDELKREVEARLTMAKDAAIDTARTQAERAMNVAETKVHQVVDRVQGSVADTARSYGFTSHNVDRATGAVTDTLDTVRSATASNAGSMAKLAGAFAVGIAIASKIHDMRRGDDWDEDDQDDRRYPSY